MAAVSGSNNEKLFDRALPYLSRCKYLDIKQLEAAEKVRTYKCKKDDINYFIKFTAVNLMSLKKLRRWQLDRGEPLVCTTFNDHRISKITERAYITKDGEVTKYPSNDIYMAIDVSLFIEGEELYAYIERNDRLKMDEVLRLAIPIAEQILSLHRSNIVHRDIKSANIMLDKERNPRLVDHEYARICTDEPLTPCGTYMAPENYVESPQNKDLYKLDSYSFGLLLYEMITKGCFSYQALKLFNEGKMGELPLNYLDKIGCDPNIKGLIKGLLERKPEERMSMSAALQALKAHPQAQRAVLKNQPDEKES